MKIETKTYVYSTFHICWGARAGLYYHDGIHKHDLQEKLFGVFPHMVARRSSMFMRGFDDTFMVPHSRHTTIRREEVEACGELKIPASSPKVGIYALSSEGGRQIFITGHSEYNAGTLQKECLRDKNAGLPSHANLLYQNRLNYFVYQATPYDLDTIEPVFAGHNTKTARQIHLDESLLRAAFPAAILLNDGSLEGYALEAGHKPAQPITFESAFSMRSCWKICAG